MQFNVGLTLHTTVAEFDRLLSDYGSMIASVYFSLPLGPHFQTRKNIERQFHSKKTIALFWELLECIQAHGVKLETLFNSYRLTNEDVRRAAEVLDAHGVKVDCVGLLDEYYGVVSECFPAQEKIFSYNNGIRTPREFDAANAKNAYDYFVIGSAAIRDNNMFHHVHGAGKKTIMLLNNACSFNCGWCKADACEQTFLENCKEHSVEYLYALQSVFPCELLDGVIDASAIDLFKISNRTSDIHFLRNCLESYVGGEVRRFLREDKNNFAMWGRMGLFWKHFKRMDLERVIACKQEILGRELIVK